MKEPKTVEEWEESIRSDTTGKRGAWCILPREIFNSDAFMALTHAEKAMLLTALNQIGYEDKKKARKRHIDDRKVLRNGGQIYLTQNELKARGVLSAATIAKGKKRLVEIGFLDVVETGSVSAPAKFQISERWRKLPNGDYKPKDHNLPGYCLYGGFQNPAL